LARCWPTWSIQAPLPIQSSSFAQIGFKQKGSTTRWVLPFCLSEFAPDGVYGGLQSDLFVTPFIDANVGDHALGALLKSRVVHLPGYIQQGRQIALHHCTGWGDLKLDPVPLRLSACLSHKAGETSALRSYRD